MKEYEWNSALHQRCSNLANLYSNCMTHMGENKAKEANEEGRNQLLRTESSPKKDTKAETAIINWRKQGD